MDWFLYDKDQACSFIKKETLAQVFCSEFCKTFKTTFLTEHLQEIASILDVFWTSHVRSIYNLYPGGKDHQREYTNQIKCCFTAQKKFSINNLFTFTEEIIYGRLH